ncbi:MAG: NAD-dependent epimerase/dehydratase family protein [Erysipelotrichaceae bacterium]|nr:NAD-dependent epimerase/dehydratase family protein [Erysipelotrichaceae bacterium]
MFDFDKELQLAAGLEIKWSAIDNKKILITGATGLIGKYLIEVILKRNEISGTDTHVIAVGRNEEKFRARFADVRGIETVSFLKHDVQQPFDDFDQRVDMIVHMASNTHPKLYATDPIGTEMSNILGTYYLLQLAGRNPGCRFVFASSGDIYGDNRSGNEFISEDDCGYINCNTLRAGYIEGKRASEALCNAYHEAEGIDFVIARFCRLYGPTMQLSDSKAISQFINKAINREDIVLKSKGTQTFSYLYIHDAVCGLLTVMCNGIDGNAYNIADNDQALSLKDLAAVLAQIGESRVVFDLPDDVEKKGASTFQNVKLDGRKLMSLSWKSRVELADGLRHTVEELRKMN